MPKVKTKAIFEFFDAIEKFVTPGFAEEVGSAVVSEARELIAAGISPVRGEGRFERYKDRKKYPGKLKDARPVNLYLSGEMLDDGFGFRQKGEKSIEVGMVKGSEERKKIASYHMDGTPTMAARPFVPQEGQEWAVSIMRKIADLFQKRLQELLFASNKK